MSGAPERALGGYFDLAYPAADSLPYRGIWLQSARAAFRLVLEARHPRRVWLPGYLCEAMYQVPAALGIAVVTYPVDETGAVAGELAPAVDELVLLVNYFGLCGHHVRASLARLPPAQVVVDHAQAFFEPPADCLATLYSPRKFFGVPDGGLLVAPGQSDLAPAVAPADEAASVARTRHLLLRLAAGAEAGYAAFHAAEASLADSRPQHGSALSARLLAGVDLAGAARQRQDNFRLLHHRLARYNRWASLPDEVSGPLCYPLVTSQPGLRAALQAQRIYVPTYWLGADSRLAPDEGGHTLLAHCLPLPCDQRYGEAEMNRLADAVITLQAREEA